MKTLSVKATYIIAGCLVTILGLMMLFAPLAFMKVFVIVLGCAAILNGVYNFISVRKIIGTSDFQKIIIIRAVASCIIGILAVFLPLILVETVWVIMLYALACELIFSAILEIIAIFKLNQAGFSIALYIIEIIITIIIVVILFAIPGQIGVTIVRIGGVLLVISGISSVIWATNTIRT